MAFSTDDFNKIWASTSPLTPYSFSESNYKEGWNFIGGTPPARQMWDYLQKLTDEKIQYIYNNLIPTGIVQSFAGITIPDGWLLCDGSAVSRTDYADLYAVIGDTYGAGDGTTTFNLPNLVDKFVQGSATAGTVKSAGLPNILADTPTTFAISSTSGSEGDNVGTGAFSVSTIASATWTRTAGSNKQLDLMFDASKSNSIYGNSITVQPPALTMQYIIKY